MKETSANIGSYLRQKDWVNIGLVFTLLYSPLLDCVYEYTDRGSIIVSLIRITYLLLFCLAFPLIYKSINYKAVVFVVSASVVYIGSIAVCNDPEVVVAANKTIVLWSIPYFLYGIGVKDFDDLYAKLKVAAIPLLIIQVVRTIFIDAFDSDETYSQGLGYDNLIPLFVYWIAFLKTRKLQDLIIPIISVSLVLMSGARGPLLCVILGLILTYVVCCSINYKKLVLLVVVVSLFYGLLRIYYIDILTWMLENFSNINVSTRTVSMLMENTMDDDSRHILHNVAKEYIAEHPISGTGMLNDRIYVYGKYRSNETVVPYGSYCHNFFYEVMMQFGGIPGAVIIIVFVKSLLTRITNALLLSEKEIVCLVIIVAFFPLLISHSYVTFHPFYLLVGMLFAGKNKQYTAGV